MRKLRVRLYNVTFVFLFIEFEREREIFTRTVAPSSPSMYSGTSFGPTIANVTISLSKIKLSLSRDFLDAKKDFEILRFLCVKRFYDIWFERGFGKRERERDFHQHT